jgi:hypothetical protein
VTATRASGRSSRYTPGGASTAEKCAHICLPFVEHDLAGARLGVPALDPARHHPFRRGKLE